MYSREITLRNTPRQPVYLRYVWQILLFVRRHLAYIWHVACENSHLGGMFLRFSPHVSAICKRDVSGQASESAIHRRDASRRQASSSYSGVQYAFLTAFNALFFTRKYF